MVNNNGIELNGNIIISTMFGLNNRMSKIGSIKVVVLLHENLPQLWDKTLIFCQFHQEKDFDPWICSV